MASSPSNILGLEQQSPGENDNTWGSINNTNLQLLENAISKRTAVTLGGVDVTLSSTQYADNQSRAQALVLTGVLSANVNVIVPAAYTKLYLVQNNCSGGFTVTVKTPAGTGVVCAQGTYTLVYNDGTNVVSVSASGGALNADTLDGFDSTAFARLAARNAWLAGNSEPYESLTDGATVTIDTALGNVFKVTIAGNRTIALSNPVDGTWIELYIRQDGTGGRTVTWPGNITWRGNATPTVTSTAAAVTKVWGRYDATLTQWFFDYALDFTSGAPAVAADIVLSQNQQNVSIFDRAGRPSGAVTVTVTISQGVFIGSDSVRTPALDFDGFASGSTIVLTNLGAVFGKGGQAGNGGFHELSDGQRQAGNDGQAGGNAIRGPGTGRTFNITNAAGRIYGGGGGGGGGGSAASGANAQAGGGGGGGGAGSGKGGQAGRVSAVQGTDGFVRYATSSGGTGGAGSASGGTGGTGGNGGDWGAAGTAGTSTEPGALGAAGLAVDQNGGTATFVSGSGGPNVLGAVT